MNVGSNGARLSALTKELSQRWQETREEWLDAKSLEFDRKYMEQLISSVDSAVTVIEQLDKLIDKIRSDCE
jgi:hypothetical protein